MVRNWSKSLWDSLKLIFNFIFVDSDSNDNSDQNAFIPRSQPDSSNNNKQLQFNFLVELNTSKI